MRIAHRYSIGRVPGTVAAIGGATPEELGAALGALLRLVERAGLVAAVEPVEAPQAQDEGFCGRAAGHRNGAPGPGVPRGEAP